MPPRPAFTLIELLVTMVIIAIISAAILGTAKGAMDAGRHAACIDADLNTVGGFCRGDGADIGARCGAQWCGRAAASGGARSARNGGAAGEGDGGNGG